MTGETTTCNGSNALQNEHQTDDPTECQSTGNRIVKGKDSGECEQNAQYRKPAPASYAEALKVKGTDKPADTAEQQPHAKNKWQGKHSKCLIAEQENR